MANVFFLEKIANDLWLSLTAIQVTAHASHHLRSVARPTFPQGVGFDILVQKLVGVQFWAIAWQTDQTELLSVRLDKLLSNNRAVYGMTVNDQIDLARRLLEQPLHEVNEQAAVKLGSTPYSGPGS